jgi:hypothetical protein
MIDLKNKDSVEAIREIITKCGKQAEISDKLEPAKFNNWALSLNAWSPRQALEQFVKITGVKE